MWKSQTRKMMAELTQELGEQMQEGQQLDEKIKQQLAKVGFSIEE